VSRQDQICSTLRFPPEPAHYCLFGFINDPQTTAMLCKVCLCLLGYPGFSREKSVTGLQNARRVFRCVKIKKINISLRPSRTMRSWEVNGSLFWQLIKKQTSSTPKCFDIISCTQLLYAIQSEVLLSVHTHSGLASLTFIYFHFQVSKIQCCSSQENIYIE